MSQVAFSISYRPENASRVLPPVAVFFKRGCAADFWINICLTILGWIPGVLHAWWIISRSEGAM
ncbi:plasma membrane proteolipid Pmp3 [Suillus ampliporus]|nr:plasma membrane proteolipid Pmp3 [Suillus ampliporus]